MPKTTEPKTERRRTFAPRRKLRKITDPVRHTITLSPRISGILGYDAETTGKSKSEVIEEALQVRFEGWKITDPRLDTGEKKPAA